MSTQHAVLQLGAAQGGPALKHALKANHALPKGIEDLRVHRAVNMLKKKSVSINKSEDKSIKVEALAEVQPTTG